MARKEAPAALAARAAHDLASGASLGGVSSMRQTLLDMAGITEAEQALLTRLVINKLTHLLSATTVQRLVVNAGLHRSEVKEYFDDDGALQARAAAELIDVLGLKPSRSQGISNTGPMTVNVTFAERPAQQAEIIDVTPR